jgi:hypothetical protein
MPDNKIDKDFFAVPLIDMIMGQDAEDYTLEKHINEYKKSWDKSDNMPESAKYFIQYMTTSNDVEQTEHHHALQKYLLKEITKSENKELLMAVKNFSEDMVGQYFQKLEDLRIEKGFANIASMYDASRERGDNGNIKNEMVKLTNDVIKDFTGADLQRRQNIFQKIGQFFAELIESFRGQNQVHQQQGEKIQQDIINPQEGFNAIKQELQDMQQQGEIDLQHEQQGQENQSISQEILHEAEVILSNCQNAVSEIVEHKGEIRKTAGLGNDKRITQGVTR